MCRSVIVLSILFFGSGRVKVVANPIDPNTNKWNVQSNKDLLRTNVMSYTWYGHYAEGRIPTDEKSVRNVEGYTAPFLAMCAHCKKSRKFSMDNYTELFIDEADQIFKTSWYDPNRTTVIFCHGFTGYPGGPAVKRIVSTYLALGQSNVALLNWEKFAAIALPGLINSYMNWALPNSIQLGANFSDTLLWMSAAGLDLNKTHLVGHSLGAHIFGIAGNKISEKGVKLPWITGLDPAIGFDMKPAILRLCPTSARFVSVIHSDPNKFGSKKELGVVDFWPNFRAFGPVLQPGCPHNAGRFSDEDFCSHNRAWQFLTDAITHPGTMLGSHAKHFRIWNKYTEEEKRRNVLEVGVFSENAIPGNYFYTTAAESPYGLSYNGL